MKNRKKTSNFNKSKCKYSTVRISECDCFNDCNMPCPHDKKKSPCDMCGIADCNKKNCDAFNIYINKQKSLQQKNDIALKMEGI